MSKINAQGSVFAILLGTNGTGKSTVLRKIADASKKRVLVIPSNLAEHTFQDYPQILPHQILSFTGRARLLCYTEEEFAWVAKRVENCMLISDDFRNYLPKPQMNPDVRRMFIDRRHKKIDIYMAAHGFTQVPPELFSWVNYVFLFKTNDNPKRHANKLLNLAAVMESQQKINQEFEKNPYYFEILQNV
jgi:hypothetical protein